LLLSVLHCCSQKLFWPRSRTQFSRVYQRSSGWWNNIAGLKIWLKSNRQRCS